MTTTTYKFGQHVVHIHDPAETPEAKAKRQERLATSCVKFWQAKEREAVKKP